jgi:hypothetical protein
MGDVVAQGTLRPVAKRTPVAAILLMLAALVTALLLTAPLASADSTGFDARPQTGSSNAEPSFFKFDADAGASVGQVLVISNRTEKTKVVRLAACDGLAAVFGGVAYSESGKRTRAVGSWIKLSRTRVVVPPNASVEVPFDVQVPTDVTSGVHLGGVALWEPAAATSRGSGKDGRDDATTKITMVTRMVLTVLVTTPGPAVPELVISGVTAEPRSDGMYVLVDVANDGTAPTSGEGAMSISGEGFQEGIALGDVVPTAGTGYPIKWKADPAVGTYQAEVQIRYADGAKVAKWSGEFAVVDKDLASLKDRLVTPESAGGAGRPWLMYGLIGGLALVVLIMAVALLRRRRPAATS